MHLALPVLPPSSSLDDSEVRLAARTVQAFVDDDLGDAFERDEDGGRREGERGQGRPAGRRELDAE